MKNIPISFISLLILFCIGSPASSQISEYSIENALMDLEAETGMIQSGQISLMSDELLDYLYENKELIPVMYPYSDPTQALEFLIPTYGQLNIMLQTEMKVSGGALTLRIAKILSMIANLSPAITEHSRAFLQTFDKTTETYKTRLSGFNQGQVGAVNTILGMAVSLFTETTTQEIQNVLYPNLIGIAPELLKQVDELYRAQCIEFCQQRIQPVVIDEMKENYEFFMALIQM